MILSYDNEDITYINYKNRIPTGNHIANGIIRLSNGNNFIISITKYADASKNLQCNYIDPTGVSRNVSVNIENSADYIYDLV